MSQPKQRLAFIDLHRGFALLVMIEVHVFNAFIQPQLKLTEWFHTLNFINGLVAPSFLFISGFAFVLAGSKKIEEFRKYGITFWRQIGRILLILIVGYSLRLPFFSLQRTLHEASNEQMRAFMSVDVLQCIAIGLLLLFLLRLAINSDRAYLWVVTALTLAFAAPAPIIYTVNLAAFMPIPIANYFNPQHGSLFPLFPWLGFMFAGAALSLLYLNYRRQGKEELLGAWLLYGGIVFIAAGHLIMADWSPLYLPMAKPHFFFFIARLGYVITILYLCWWAEKKFSVQRLFLMDVGRESLLVYWLHLQVIYRQAINGRSLFDVVNRSWGVWECIGGTVALALLMVGSAKIWGLFKRRFPAAVPYIVLGVILGCLLFFFSR